MTRISGLLLGAALILAALPALGDVAVPQVTGPIAAPDVPGAPSHNYIFFASNHDLAAHGYVEEEYFIRGTASTYTITDPQKTAAVKDSGIPYYTRVVVRRPADPKRFNGTALVEWDNVTNQFDAENVWFFDWEHMMRAGYVWVGVSPQTVGIAALKKWSPARYGEFDVGKVVAGTGPRGGPDADAESYDIFSQVGAALRHPAGVDMLHGLKPKILLAAGESQSASRLANYANSVQPLAHIYDGFLLLSAVGQRIRDDVMVPVFKINTEHDTVTGDAAVWQPDTAKFRSWDVAGSSHVDQHLRASREPLELRDNGLSLEARMAPLCANPQVGTRVPTGYVVGSAFDKLAKWAAGGPPPPSAPHLDITQVNQRPAQSVVARNEDHLAQGGIQLSQLAVPTQINFGVGGPADPGAAAAGGEAIGAGACVRWGYSVDMPAEALAVRYSSHAAYVAAVKKVTDANVKKGYILPFDGATTIREAQESRIGR
jgi:Alpha/beta hydrolase domain